MMTLNDQLKDTMLGVAPVSTAPLPFSLIYLLAQYRSEKRMHSKHWAWAGAVLSSVRHSKVRTLEERDILQLQINLALQEISASCPELLGSWSTFVSLQGLTHDERGNKHSTGIFCLWTSNRPTLIHHQGIFFRLQELVCSLTIQTWYVAL